MTKVPRDVVVEQYLLKASFFSSQLDEQKLIGLHERAVKAIQKIEANLDWSTPLNFNVPKEVVEQINSKQLKLSFYVCHPLLLLSHPWLLTYFRCLAAFSQKGLSTISGVSAIKEIEAGRECTPAQAQKLSFALNNNLSAILIANVPTAAKINGLVYATAGATLEGSWRNQIGEEGERVFKTVLLKAIWEKGEIASFNLKDNSIHQVQGVDGSWLDKNAKSIRSALFTNGALAQFSSEPDVTLINAQGKIVAGIEIKAGLDPAAALERLGAMIKSFDRIKLNEPSAETILVASCITPEVQSRISGSGGVSRTFILTDIIKNKDNKGTHFVSIVRGLLALSTKQR